MQRPTTVKTRKSVNTKRAKKGDRADLMAAINKKTDGGGAADDDS